MFKAAGKKRESLMKRIPISLGKLRRKSRGTLRYPLVVFQAQSFPSCRCFLVKVWHLSQRRDSRPMPLFAPFIIPACVMNCDPTSGSFYPSPLNCSRHACYPIKWKSPASSWIGHEYQHCPYRHRTNNSKSDHSQPYPAPQSCRSRHGSRIDASIPL